MAVALGEKDKFPMGLLAMSIGISNAIKEGEFTDEEILKLFARHVSGDYGDLEKYDINANENAILYGGRILSSYTLKGKELYVITEADRSCTTVLFKNDY